MKNVIRTDKKEEVLHSLLTLRVLTGTHATIENQIDGSKQASAQGSKLITVWQSIFFLIEDP